MSVRGLQKKVQDASCTEAHCRRDPANKACDFNRRRSAGSRRVRLHPTKSDRARSLRHLSGRGGGCVEDEANLL